MLRIRKVDFNREICRSVVHLDTKICLVTDDSLHEKGKKCFTFALKEFELAYPSAVHITKEEIGKYKKSFAIRGFAGRGTKIKVCHDGRNTVDGYCILCGFEIYQKIGNYWLTREPSTIKRYKDNGKIPDITFPYAPTSCKLDDAFFQNPLAEYVEYFGVN